MSQLTVPADATPAAHVCAHTGNLPKRPAIAVVTGSVARRTQHGSQTGSTYRLAAFRCSCRRTSRCRPALRRGGSPPPPVFLDANPTNLTEAFCPWELPTKWVQKHIPMGTCGAGGAQPQAPAHGVSQKISCGKPRLSFIYLFS